MRTNVCRLSRSIKNAINDFIITKKKDNVISLINCIANIFLTIVTTIAVIVALVNNRAMLKDNNRPILRVCGIERIENINSIPLGMNFYMSGLDMNYDSSKPDKTVIYKVKLQITPNNELISSNILSHSNGLDFRTTYSETKIVEDRSYYVFEKNEKIDIYICGGVNDEIDYHQFYYLFSYQDIFKTSYFNILHISGNKNGDGFNYEFMPQDTIQRHSIINLQDDVMQIIKKLKKFYAIKYT